MKKFLPILFLSAMLFSIPASTSAAEQCPVKNRPGMEQPQKMRLNFEQRLKLTDVQKEKARKIHEKGFKQMKPIMQKKDQLKVDIATIKKSNLDEKTKAQKISKDKKELQKLHQKAENIRKANGKEFEKILTKDQLDELAKMKAEGRRNFERTHRPRPPFDMFQPGFKGFRPMMPPPED